MADVIRLTKSEERRLQREWGLTPREVEVASALLRDMRLGEVAGHLGISPKTANTFLTRGRRRVGGRTQVGFALAILAAIGRIRTTRPRARSRR